MASGTREPDLMADSARMPRGVRAWTCVRRRSPEEMAESWGKAVRRRVDWVPLPTPRDGGLVGCLTWFGMGGRGRGGGEGEGRRTWGADKDDAGCFGELHWGWLMDGETERRGEVVVKVIITTIVEYRVAEDDNNGPPISVRRL